MHSPISVAFYRLRVGQFGVKPLGQLQIKRVGQFEVKRLVPHTITKNVASATVLILKFEIDRATGHFGEAEEGMSFKLLLFFASSFFPGKSSF